MNLDLKKLFLILSMIIASCQLKSHQEEARSALFDINKKKYTPLPSCKWDFKYNVGKSIVAGLCFLFATFILICGYKKRRISFFLTGFTSVSILTYLAVVVEADFSLLENIAISLAAGLVVSFFTSANLYCGYFITGLLAGFLVGLVFLLVYTTFLKLTSIALPCVIVAVFALFQVFITMWWRHRMLILSSCLFSSAVMTASIDYFVENLFLFEYIELKIFYGREAKVCWWSFVVFGVWPLLFIIGLLIQCLCTGKTRQKESYTFIYRRKTTTHQNHTNDDHNHLIRYGYESYSP